MLNTDKTDFYHQLGILFAAYNVPLTEDRKEAFWYGLHECRLSEITLNVAKLCEVAKKGAPVPRPADLRNVLPDREYQPKDPKIEASFQAAEKFAARTWHEFETTDPELARLDLTIARAGRILARDHEGSPQYAEALQDDRRARDRRADLWRRRAADKPSRVWT